MRLQFYLKCSSLTPEVYQMAQRRMAALGLTNFSAYIALLIRNDSIQGGALVMRETPAIGQVSTAAPKGKKGYREVKT
jgi:hypothetical protein